MVCASVLSFLEGKICAMQEPSVIIIVIITTEENEEAPKTACSHLWFLNNKCHRIDKVNNFGLLQLMTPNST